MLDTINTALTTIDDFIWGLPLIIAILAVGLFMTFRLKGLQVTKFPLAVKELFSNERSGEDGEVSSFAALCTVNRRHSAFFCALRLHFCWDLCFRLKSREIRFFMQKKA